MAQINIEPRPKRSALPVILLLIVIVAVAVAVYLYLDRGRLGGADRATPAAANDTVGVTAPR